MLHVTSCYSVTRVHVTCYSDSVTVLLNMLLGYCIYVYAYMLHTCESVPLNGWERWDWGPVAGGKTIGVAVAVAVAPPFLRFWEATPTHSHWLSLAAALHTINLREFV